MADYDGDCDVDSKDVWAFIQRYVDYDTTPIPGCVAALPDCPGSPGGGEGGDGGEPLPMTTALAGSFVDYLSLEDLPAGADPVEFMMFVQDVTDWLIVNLPDNEKTALAAQLEDPALTCEMPLAAEMAVDVACQLCGHDH